MPAPSSSRPALYSVRGDGLTASGAAVDRSSPYAAWSTRLIFVLGDVVGLLSVLVTTYWLSGWYSTALAHGVLDYGLAVVLPLMLLAFAVAGLYGNVVIHPALEMQRASIVSMAVGGTAGLTVYLTTGSLAPGIVVAGSGLIGAVVMPLCRGMFRIMCGPLSWWGLPAVIVGESAKARSVIRTLRRWPEIGLRPVAIVEPEAAAGVILDPAHAQDDLSDDVSVLTAPDGALQIARLVNVPYVILAIPGMPHVERAKMLTHYSKFFDHVFVVGDAEGSPALWTTGRSGEGLLGYGVRNFALQPAARFAKRAVDLLLSAIGILLVAPVLATIAVLIRLDSRGPVFYRQQRMGLEGRVFTVLKFRTMYTDAHEKLKEILDSDPEKRREYECYHKLQDDPRVTAVGRVLRRYSLDELPQLLNVLWGDMSLVGPRAYMPSELRKMNGLVRSVLQTPPGITGLWQVSGRNDVSFDERVNLDVHYMQNWSPWLDFYLLVRTFPVVMTGKGAS